MSELDAYRQEIDEIDRELTALFLRRMAVTKQVGLYKQSRGLPVLDAQREAEVLAKKVELADTSENKVAVNALFEAIMGISRRQQRAVVKELGNTDYQDMRHMMAQARPPLVQPKVVYQGVTGAYAEEATALFFGESVPRQGRETWEELFVALAEREADYAVLPIENNATGAINQVYDLLAKYGHHIVGEQLVKVDHCLMAPKGATLDSIQEVYSHQQGLLQCCDFLGQHPSWKGHVRLNTAEAGQFVAQSNDVTKGAICSRRVAQLYDMDILAEHISVHQENYTRFVVVAPAMEFRPGSNKVSALMVLPHRSGALHEIMSIFAVNNLNLLKLESRPIIGKSWEYRFFVDFSGNLQDPDMEGVLQELSQTSEQFRVLGNYPICEV